jgi:hypothetical protein
MVVGMVVVQAYEHLAIIVEIQTAAPSHEQAVELRI